MIRFHKKGSVVQPFLIMANYDDNGKNIEMRFSGYFISWVFLGKRYLYRIAGKNEISVNASFKSNVNLIDKGYPKLYSPIHLRSLVDNPTKKVTFKRG